MKFGIIWFQVIYSYMLQANGQISWLSHVYKLFLSWWTRLDQVGDTPLFFLWVPFSFPTQLSKGERKDCRKRVTFTVFYQRFTWSSTLLASEFYLLEVKLSMTVLVMVTKVADGMGERSWMLPRCQHEIGQIMWLKYSQSFFSYASWFNIKV